MPTTSSALGWSSLATAQYAWSMPKRNSRYSRPEVSAVFASVVGSLFAHKNGFITPDVGSFFRSVELVTMVVLGGMASTFGAVIGAVLLTLLPQFLASFEDYEAMVLGAIMMGTMIFMPKGLLPSLRLLWSKRRGAP